MQMTDGTLPAPNSGVSSRDLLHAVFPSLLFGLAGLLAFVLFATVYASAGGTSPFLGNTGDMASFGFFVGFAGRLAYVFDRI